MASHGNEKPIEATVSEITSSSPGNEMEKSEQDVQGEKLMEATVSEIPPTPLAEEVVRPQNPERLQGSFTSIIYGAALPCVPIFLVTGILLGLIFHYEVTQETGWPELYLPQNTEAHEGILAFLEDWRNNGGTHAYYVNYNPSTLTTIASWTGKVVPYLTSSVMALVAFFAARRIVEASKDPEHKDLPTPHQLTLLIGLLSGGSITPLKDTLKYRWMKKEKLVNPIPYAFGALAAVTLIGLLIPLADTWFGAAVRPFKVVQLTQESSTLSFGRTLSSSVCPTPGTDNTRLPCNIDQLGAGSNAHYDLANAPESCMTMNGVSPLNSVMNYTHNGQDFYYFLTHPSISLNRDFRTRTTALSTQCQPMTSTCFPDAQKNSKNVTIGSSTQFSCTPGFFGDLKSNGALAVSNKHDLSSPMAAVGFSPDAQLSSMVGSDSSETVYSSNQNPLYFGAWAIGYPSSSPDAPMSLLGPEVFADEFGDYVWMLNCSTTIFDVTYSWINGSVHNFTYALADAGMGGVVSSPYTMGIHMAQLALGLTSTMAGFQPDSNSLATMWSQLFSSYSAAVIAGAMEETVNDFQQLRNDALGVTRVPMVPLYVLLSLKFLYALAAVGLAFAAISFTNPAEAQSVKERLSVKGLATAYFAEGKSHQAMAVKNLEDLFTDTSKKEDNKTAEDPEAAVQKVDKKVGIVQTEVGDWQFVTTIAGKTWDTVGPLVQSTLLGDANKGTFGMDGRVAADVYTLVK